ncbi:MAG: peptidoglycan DD-metalloendopeptidase family protein [Lachnospiraceae bacterium]|nr:peptidoglycan DD-metalloendopeptidase family protein [Lachnospiraceae bacterium]
MRNTRNSIWKDKVFLSMMTVCLIAVVAVAANMIGGRSTSKKDKDAEYTTSQSETEEQTITANIGIEGGMVQTDAEIREDGVKTVAGVESSEKSDSNIAQNTTGKQTAETSAADESGKTEVARSPENTAAESASVHTANETVLNYDGSSAMTWPVEGELLMEFAMDHTVYHATLEQYKVSPGVLIQSEVGAHVTTPSVGLVQEIGWNEEIGNFLRIDLGSSYEAVIGELENITVQPGQYVAPGNILGTVAAPTKYYSVEGPNVYFELTKDGVACDPLQYLE